MAQFDAAGLKGCKSLPHVVKYLSRYARLTASFSGLVSGWKFRFGDIAIVSNIQRKVPICRNLPKRTTNRTSRMHAIIVRGPASAETEVNSFKPGFYYPIKRRKVEWESPAWSTKLS
jgi:hypothetical protein